MVPLTHDRKFIKTVILFIHLVDGAIGEWGGFLFGHLDVYFAICSNSTFGSSRECSAPMNGGVPCQESLVGDLPKRHKFGSPYRCNCEIRNWVFSVICLLLS